MKPRFNFDSIPLIILTSVSVLILNACKDTSKLSAKDSSPFIPHARVGLDGEHDLSGLAKRVAEALKKDATLVSISSIYVAQTESKIILKGAVANQNLLDRVVTVARNVKGVTDVDASQVQIR